MLHYRLDSSSAPPTSGESGVNNAPPRPGGHRGHAHFWERAFSRRRFVRTATGATALVVGQGLWFPAFAGAAPAGGSDPRPIPFTLPIPGFPPLHVDFPWYGNENSTITDFDGVIASAEIQGTGTGTDAKTGQTTRFTFDADMRFMDGTYVSLNGQTRRGTFGFIWLDLFTGQFDQQVHDYEPGIAKSGLFWTVPVPSHSVSFNLAAGTARFSMNNLQIEDYHDFLNSIGLLDPPIKVDHSAHVSFDTRWEAIGPVTTLNDPTKDFGGQFRRCRATIEWSARNAASHFSFVSDPASTTYNLPDRDPVIGRERNGVFFP